MAKMKGEGWIAGGWMEEIDWIHNPVRLGGKGLIFRLVLLASYGFVAEICLEGVEIGKQETPAERGWKGVLGVFRA